MSVFVLYEFKWRCETVFSVDSSHIKYTARKNTKKIMIVYKIEFGEICAIVFRQVLQLLSRHSGASEAQGALQDVLSSLRAGYVNHTVQAIPATRPPATNGYSVSYDDFSNCKS